MSLYFPNINRLARDESALSVREASGCEFDFIWAVYVAGLSNQGSFELVVIDSNALKPGTSEIAAQSAYVTLAHGLVPGNADRLEIHFFATQVTEKVKADIIETTPTTVRQNFVSLGEMPDSTLSS